MKKSYARTPTIFQMEATECGAASLAMVLSYFGRHIPLEQMRIETGVSRDGCNAGNIVLAAQKFGLEAHGYRKDLDALFTMPVPAIIHWNFNHFVVWEGRKGDDCYINDPAMGRRKLTVQDMDDCFTGIILTFKPTDSFEKSKQERTLFSFIKERLKGQYSALAALVITGLFLVIPGLPMMKVRDGGRRADGHGAFWKKLFARYTLKMEEEKKTLLERLLDPSIRPWW